jgi:uncharacterized protein
MKCPNCGELLLITERHKVEIDYCPSCRGVWLDKGELDKVIEYASNNAETYFNKNDSNSRPYYNDKDHYKQDDHKQNYNKHHKKKSIFGDLFDFG